MRQYKNLTIIGTSHIAIESIKEVKDVISKIKPKIVALELDRKRFQSLIYKKKRRLKFSDIKHIGLKGYLFNLIGAWVEKKLGKTVGVLPGSEMKKAVKIAYQLKSDIALIDQDIEITLKKLSKRITWKEKFRFVADILKGLIFRKPEITFDLKKVPSEKIIKKLTSKVKKRYPSFYLTLIKERDAYMAKALYSLTAKYPNKKIVAVVGAGHEQDIINLIKNLKKIKKGVVKFDLLKPKLKP